jgi:hypothetical protein
MNWILTTVESQLRNGTWHELRKKLLTSGVAVSGKGRVAAPLVTLTTWLMANFVGGGRETTSSEAMKEEVGNLWRARECGK